MSLSMTKLAVGFKEYLLMAIGMFMYAFGWVACVIPAGGMGGGATGLSMIFNAYRASSTRREQDPSTCGGRTLPGCQRRSYVQQRS